MKKILSLTALVGVFLAHSSQATLVSGSGLQSALSGAGAIVNVDTDQVAQDAYWMTGSSTVSSANILFEFAGNAGVNSFGIYDRQSPGTQLQIFGGAASAGSIALFANSTISGGKQFCTATLFSPAINCATFTGGQFGFYVSNSVDTFFSDSTLNADNQDHLVAYQGNYSWSNPSYINGSPWLANEFVLAWEDLFGGGDHDYDDFVVLVESVVNVPEPTTLGLFGMGLLGLGLRSRKKRS